MADQFGVTAGTGQSGFFENLMMFGYGWRAALALIRLGRRAAPSGVLFVREQSAHLALRQQRLICGSGLPLPTAN